MEWLIVTLASFAAGLVDAIVGGGGLILIPARIHHDRQYGLLGVFPS